MMTQQQWEAFSRIESKVSDAFDQPPRPAIFPRQSDVVLLMRHSDSNRDVLHIWFEAEQRLVRATRIFWRQAFDLKRLSDPYMSSRYGTHETPSLSIVEHVPVYEEFEMYLADLFGAVPVNTTHPEAFRGSEREPKDFILAFRLPLGEMCLTWDVGSGDTWWTFSGQCHRFHDWLLKTPVLKP